MVTTDPYRSIVELYDLEHDPFTEDIGLILQIASACDEPILELGCGSGRVLYPLARTGYTTTGIDSSEAMLAGARERCAGMHNVGFYHGDMSHPQEISPTKFGLVLASLNSIMHLTTPVSLRSAIEGAHTALENGGVLFIDILNPNPEQLQFLFGQTHLEWSYQDSKRSIDKWGYRQPGDKPQILDTLIWYDIVDVTTGSYQRLRTRFDLRYVHQSELALMLEISGFGRVDWYGSYDLDPWTMDAERIIAIAHKDAG